MNFEALQTAWQRQPITRTASPDVRWELMQTRADSRAFRRSIFWRDVREVLASVVVAVIFGRIAWAAQSEGDPAWPAWLATAMPVGVALFLLSDQIVMRRRLAPRGDPLRVEIARAAAGVRHQIYLLRRLVWWYLGPLALSGVFLGLQMGLYGLTELPAVARMAIGGLVLLPFLPAGWWVWTLNQKAVRTKLAPRLAELEQRLAELAEMPNDAATGD